MEGSPLVTIVIPACEAEATLARALDSAVRQDYRPIEIVVVDDASTDGSTAVVEAYAQHGARLVRRPRRGGASVARNDGIAAASGELIAFLDADDEWLPGKLAKQVPVIRGDDRVVFVSCGSLLIGHDGRELGPLYDGQIPRSGDQAWRGLLARNTIATPSVLARRRDLLDAGGFDPALRVGEDQDMWIRLSMRGHLGYVDEPLVRVHATPNSLSSGSFREHLDATLPLVQRYIALKRHELSHREVNAILRERWARIGRSAYGQGFYRDGLSLLARAIARGDRPLGNLLFLLGGAPPVRRLKRLLRTGRG